LGELKRVVIGLLQNIDALSPETVLVAATNHEHLLDPAIWRRFATRLKLDIPEFNVRRRMIASWMGSFGSEELADFIAALTEGLSGAEIRRRVDFTLKRAITAGKHVLKFSDDLSLFTSDIHKRADRNELIRKLRAVDSRRFTYRRLASVFELSIGQISTVLREE
jgi:AAA+ superfamily predicted ATPase